MADNLLGLIIALVILGLGFAIGLAVTPDRPSLGRLPQGVVLDSQLVQAQRRLGPAMDLCIAVARSRELDFTALCILR